jgi:hypothetical protein
MVFFPRFRINLKPLIPEGMDEVDAKKVLKAVQKEILKSLRDEIQDQAFSHKAKAALAKGMTTKMGPNSLTVIATHPAFLPLLDGQKRQQMTWLTKAKTPIPIILDSGELIFRNATPHSMDRGRWYHPGRQPTTVIEKARDHTREVVKKRLAKELQRRLSKSVRGGR